MRISLVALFLMMLSFSCATPYRIDFPVVFGDRYFLPVTWYGGSFHGQQTASGENFDKSAMTCAAYQFPFGTCLKITNPHNNKSVVVRVTDRPGKSVVDLSESAFSHIAKNSVGRLYARVVVVSCGENRNSAPVNTSQESEKQEQFTVEVALFDDLEEAGQFLDALHVKGGYIFSPKQGRAVFHVRVSSFSSKADAEAFIKKHLPNKGAVVVTLPH